MSNPTVTISNIIPDLPDPQVVRNTFTKIVYNSQKFFTYGANEYDPTYIDPTKFDPKNKGEEFFYFIPESNALVEVVGDPPVKPDFVSDNMWTALQESSSGFVTAVKSIMPKLIVPSRILVDNGIETPNRTKWAYYKEGPSASDERNVFNWKLLTLNSVSIPDTDTDKYASKGNTDGASYVTILAKKKDEDHTTFVMKLKNPTNPPKGSDHNWLKGDSTDLVVTGAFVLMLNMVPTRAIPPSNAAGNTPTKTAEKQPTMTLEFGEVKMVISTTGETKVTIGQGTAAEQNATTVNLAEGKAKGGPPQQNHLSDKEPYIILVYPVWNGIVIASGIQDAHATVFSSSYYVPKLKSAAIMVPPYSQPFDPADPQPVFVEVGSGGESVMVNFGSNMTVTAQDCRFEIAYLPCFFTTQMWFDEWRIQPDSDPGSVEYEYFVFPIWTANNTSTILDPDPTVAISGYVGPITNTHYAYTKWRLKQDQFNRHAGEIFGSILQVRETREFPIRNNNGSFNLTWTGGTPGDPAPDPDWSKYVRSLNVTINVDGSSGSITVDKYGLAGQHAEVDQSIGAITIDAQGGYGTVSGRIFAGLAMGIQDSRSVDGATWVIPLIGQERKMEDICLINVPFFDGETVQTTLDYLCRYAGLNMDLSYADPLDKLGVSTDINVVRFDWKAGTTVRAAIEDVMADTLHHFVVRDGEIWFYKLDDTSGLPKYFLGTDWEPSYPETKIVMYDAAPDFEDLRNEIVVVGLEQIPEGNSTALEGLPTFLRLETRENVTIPDIPWAKTMVRPIPGYMEIDKIGEYADKVAAESSVYELIGTTSIPGNASIHPYDRWGDLVIFGVAHEMDFQAKTWTTKLEFMRRTLVSISTP